VKNSNVEEICVHFSAPKPPEQFVLSAGNTAPIKIFRWHLPINNNVDLLVLRVCLKKDMGSCILEKKYTEPLPTKFVLQEKVNFGTFVAYMFSQSMGVNSVPTEKLTFDISKFSLLLLLLLLVIMLDW